MGQKQAAAITAINQLSIELITIVNQQDSPTNWDIYVIHQILDRISSEVNHLNNYESLEKIFGITE